MGIFSSESMLLIKHWDAVRDILNAEKRLRNELSTLLYSIEADLCSNDWWQDGWVFAKNSPSEIYISKRNWRVNDVFVVLIGVEGFVPESIFGSESQPALYVYVLGKRYNLAKKLAEQITEVEDHVLGEVERRSASGYVIRHPVKQCLPEEAEGFSEVVHSQIVHFFTHYANVLENLDGTIQELLVVD